MWRHFDGRERKRREMIMPGGRLALLWSSFYSSLSSSSPPHRTLFFCVGASVCTVYAGIRMMMMIGCCNNFFLVLPSSPPSLAFHGSKGSLECWKQCWETSTFIVCTRFSCLISFSWGVGAVFRCCRRRRRCPLLPLLLFRFKVALIFLLPHERVLVHSSSAFPLFPSSYSAAK